MKLDHHQILGVKPTDTLERIKEAYKGKRKSCKTLFEKEILKDCYKACINECRADVSEYKSDKFTETPLKPGDYETYKSERNSDSYNAPIKEFKNRNLGKEEFNNLFENITTPLYARNKGAKDFRSLQAVDLSGGSSFSFQPIIEYNSVMVHDNETNNGGNLFSGEHTNEIVSELSQNPEKLNMVLREAPTFEQSNYLKHDNSEMSSDNDFISYKKELMLKELQKKREILSSKLKNDNSEYSSASLGQLQNPIDENKFVDKFTPRVNYSSKRR